MNDTLREYLEDLENFQDKRYLQIQSQMEKRPTQKEAKKLAYDSAKAFFFMGIAVSILSSLITGLVVWMAK